jgi:4-amino-4-deoxy-L-arabinose transferase-like glycosyltransferase
VTPARLGALLATGAALVALAVPLFEGLGRTDLEGDEAIYAGVVERMIAGGPWLSPPDENGPFLEKPPLRFWIVAAVMEAGLLRPTEGGHRAVDAMFGAAALLYTFLVARRLGGLAAGVGAVFFAVTQRQFLFVHGLRSGTMEPLLVLAYCGAAAHLLFWAEGGRRAHALAVACFLAAGILAKFVAAVPLVLVLLLAVALQPSWRRRAVADRRAWVAAIALCAALSVPWFAYLTVRHGHAIWEFMLGLHVFARVASYVDPAHVQPWWYYLHFLARGLPDSWGYLAAGGLALAWRAWKGRAPGAALVALWAAVPVLLFSLSTSKLGHYVFPAVPALAVIAGQAFALVVAVLRGAAAAAAPPERARTVALAVAALALLAAIFVGVEMRGSIAFRGRIYGPASPAPAVLVALAAVVASVGGWRVCAGLFALAWIAADVEYGYQKALVRARARGRHLGGLADCVRARLGGRPAAFHVHAERGLGRDEKYYFRRVGLEEDPEGDLQRLESRVRDPAEPVVITVAQYRRLVARMARWADEEHARTSVALLPHRDLVVFLPGDLRPCAAAARRFP